MIIVKIKDGENIDRALKQLKRKFERIGITKELRRRMFYEKPSVTRRNEILKATYIQKLRDQENNN